MAVRSIARLTAVSPAAGRSPAVSASSEVPAKYVAMLAAAKSAGHAKERALANGEATSSASLVF